MKDITGLTFGYLTVTKLVGRALHRNRSMVWECKCRCGNKRNAFGIDLRSGRVLSCGCRGIHLRSRQNKSHPQWRGVGDISQSFWGKLERQAKTRNLEVKMSLNDAWEIFIKQNKKCALTGLELRFGIFANDPNQTASLDRIDSYKGYTIDNVQWVHKRINVMKMHFPQEEFIALCRLVSQSFPSLIEKTNFEGRLTIKDNFCDGKTSTLTSNVLSQ